ncbi:MAG: hypothetical protein EOP83_19815, partial [Verrucomicrobiaceae bacterium]
MIPPSRTRTSAFSTLSALLASAAITFTLAPGTAIAQQQVARLVKDTNRDLSPTNTNIGWVAPLPKGVVFLHGNRDAQQDLWTSNGDAKSTRLLQTTKEWSFSKPFPFGTGAAAKVAIDRTGADGTVGLEVWVTDGTDSGTLPIFLPAANYETEVLAGTSTGFFFDHRPWTQSDGLELYFSDGTVAGTRSLNPWDGVNPRRFATPEFAFTDGAWFYFIANSNEIWRSDGTDAGTTKLVTVPVATTSGIQLRKAGQQMFITVTSDTFEESGLWSSPLDGGTITRLFPAVSEGWQTIDQTIALGDDLLFTTHDNLLYFKLWRTDGTVAGTREIAIPTETDFRPYDGEFTLWHGSVYFLPEFTNFNAFTQHEVLFRIDSGSDSLTQLGKLGLGSSLIPPTPWREKEAALYFYKANPVTSTTELWMTSGDVKSTKLAKLPANHYLRTTEPSEVTDTSLGIFFAGTGLPKNEVEALYRAKGKKGATRLTTVPTWTASGIVSFPEPPTLAPSTPLYEKVGASLLAFVNIDSTFELWSMNPNGSKAKAIWEPEQGLQNDTTPLIRATFAGGTRAIFTCIGADGDTQLWSTDGTKKGTVLLATHQELPHDFVMVGDTCYYSLIYAALCKTDGTPEGTSIVSELDMRPSNLAAFQGNVWFTATDASGKKGVWRSDGTAAGTVVVKDTWHDTSPVQEPVGFSVVEGKLTFWVDLRSAQGLWQSDGTTEGTVAVTAPDYFKSGSKSPVADFNGVAIFPARKST